ncbi:hypothetical protein CCP3SC1_430021 [Gammaproteobacteria bacterium]
MCGNFTKRVLSFLETPRTKEELNAELGKGRWGPVVHRLTLALCVRSYIMENNDAKFKDTSVTVYVVTGEPYRAIAQNRGAKRVSSVSLSPELFAKAARIGHGNTSAGIQRALAAWNEETKSLFMYPESHSVIPTKCAEIQDP